MIHYHGTPITPESAAGPILAGRHAMVSFATPIQLQLVTECCASFAYDNGAFSAWRSGNPIREWTKYYDSVRDLSRHPAFDFALIPDVIDGTESDNDALIGQWPYGDKGCPIWHLHESLHKLSRLIEFWPRVALGSSGEYADIGTSRWWKRMHEAWAVICRFGWPMTKIHGLRMLDPEIFTRFPFSSADSCNIARNIGIDGAWRGTYQPTDKTGRGIVMANRIEAHQSPATWTQPAMQSEFPIPGAFVLFSDAARPFEKT